MYTYFGHRFCSQASLWPLSAATAARRPPAAARIGRATGHAAVPATAEVLSASRP